MFDLSPLLLWSEEKLCSWAVSPCLRNTQQRRAWRELAIGLRLSDSKVKGHVYVEDNAGYLLTATNYRYVVDEDDNLNEWLDFSIIRPDNTVTDTLLYVPVDRFSVSVDSYHFGNLVNYSGWHARKSILDIANKYMGV